MTYFADVQDAAIREKLRLFVTGCAEFIGDNDEAVDNRFREAEEVPYRDGFEFSAPCYLGFYWSSGTGTPLHDKLIERLLDAQEYEWAQQFPARKSLRDILALDEDSEFRNEAEEWELAAFEDEVIYIRVEAIREDGDIRIRSCFMNEINAPFGDEYEVTMPESDFLALDAEGLEKLGIEVSEAPYKVTEL